MARQFYRKKFLASPEKANEWVLMDAKEFYQFIISDEGKGRYFIDLGDIVIEASKKQYNAWRREKDHSDYLREQESSFLTVSLYSNAIAEFGSGVDVITDERINIEQEVAELVNRSDLCTALASLDEDSYQLIYNIYLAKERKTLRQLSKENGIPVMTIQNRKKKILERLRKEMLKKKI